MGLADYKYSGEGLPLNDKRWGKKRFDEYQKLYPHLNKLSDLQLLEELVYLEVLQDGYKNKAKGIVENTELDETCPVYLQKQMKENLDQMLVLKRELNMFESKEKLDAFEHLKELAEKFKLWRQKNQGSRTVTCPFCSKMFVLMIRTDKYEVKKSPFFEDKMLCNPEMHKWWKEGRITAEEYATALGTSPDFPDWLDKHWFEKFKKTE